MTVRRIVFTGDFLRPHEAGWGPSQAGNARWLRNLLGEQVALASRLPVEACSWRLGDPPELAIDDEAVRAVYTELDAPPNLDGWAQVFAGEEVPQALNRLVAERFAGSLVIGFELPPIVNRALASAGIPVIEVIVHPLRFLDDVFLGFRSSEPDCRSVLATHAVSEDQVRVMAGLQKATAARQLAQAPIAGSAVFLMQVTHDLSQISNGRFLTTEDFIDEIAAIADAHSVLYVKEHPLQPASRYSRLIFERCPNAKATTENFYRLAAAPEILTVAAISSSACTEARFFGKRSEILYRVPHALAFRGDPLDDRVFAGVLDAYLAPDFWRALLRPLASVTPEDGMKVPFKPNRLRVSLGAFWGFNEIDSDAVAREYLASSRRAPSGSLMRRVTRQFRSGWRTR